MYGLPLSQSDQRILSVFQSVCNNTKYFMIDSTDTSRSAVFTSYFGIFHDQTHNKDGTYLFRVFLAVKTALPEECADWLFKI